MKWKIQRYKKIKYNDKFKYYIIFNLLKIDKY